MGQSAFPIESRGIETTVPRVHLFLNSFFHYYIGIIMNKIDNYKDEFLRFINMPYGYSPIQRLKYLQKENLN